MIKYYYKGVLIGMKITRMPAGSHPQTDPNTAVGLLTFKHLQGEHFLAHRHRPKKRITYRRQECFIVRKGKIAMKLFGPDGHYFKTVTISKGELFLALDGGHDITVINDCEVFEIKNGPFIEDKVIIGTKTV